MSDSPEVVDLRASGSVVERRGIAVERTDGFSVPGVTMGPAAGSGEAEGMSHAQVQRALPLLREAKSRFHKHLGECAECRQRKEGRIREDRGDVGGPVHTTDFCDVGLVLLEDWLHVHEQFGDQLKGDDAWLMPPRSRRT